MIFKEWLAIDSINEEIYKDCLNRIFVEKAAENTLKFFIESLEEEDDDDGTVELDDPFSGGEDAQPVSVSDEEPDDEEQSDVDPLDRASSRSDSWGQSDKNRIELARKLKNAILWTRWNAILQRKKLIQKLKDMHSGEFNFDQLIDDDDEDKDKDGDDNRDGDESKPSTEEKDREDTQEILEKLGYINKEKFNNSSSKVQSKLFDSALQSAIKEKGNDLPDDIGEEEILKKAEPAKQAFFEILRDVFDEDYRRVAFSSRNLGLIKGTKEKGFKLFGDEDEVANNFILRMFKSITDRPWAKSKGSKGQLSPWKPVNKKHPELGQGGKKDIEEDDFVEDILGAYRSWIYKEPSKAERDSRKSNSPSAGSKDEISNRDKKKSRINIDVKKAIEAKEKVANAIRDGKPPVDKKWDNSLKTYKDYIEAYRNGRQATFEATSEEDKFRLEIMQHIEFLHSRYSDLLSMSPDPDSIIRTLLNYRERFLSKSRSAPAFFGSMGGDDDDKGSWDAASPSDDERSYGRGATSNPDGGISTRSTNSSAIAQANQERNNILEKLKQAMIMLKIQNPSWALAVCIKLGLNCANDGTIRSVEGLANMAVSLSSSKKIEKLQKQLEIAKKQLQTSEVQRIEKEIAAAINCAKQMQSIGLNPQETAEEISKRLGPTELEKVRQWINKGLDFLCEKIKALMSQQNTAPNPLPVVPSPKMGFDPSRASPLARFRK